VRERSEEEEERGGARSEEERGARRWKSDGRALMRHRNNTLPIQCLYSRVAGLPFCGPLNAFRNDPEDNVGVVWEHLGWGGAWLR